MQIRVGETIRNLDVRSRVTCSGTKFERCRFEQCSFSPVLDPTNRLTVDDCVFVGCSFRSTQVGSVYFRQTRFENVATHGLLQIWGAAFEQVVMAGKFGRVMISDRAFAIVEPTVQAVFEAANADIYRNAEWALDITNASFVEADFRNLPSSLLRLDPETQVAVTKDQVLGLGQKELQQFKSSIEAQIECLLDGECTEVVLIASKLADSFKDEMHDIALLRSWGVVS